MRMPRVIMHDCHVEDFKKYFFLRNMDILGSTVDRRNPAPVEMVKNVPPLFFFKNRPFKTSKTVEIALGFPKHQQEIGIFAFGTLQIQRSHRGPDRPY